MAEDDSGGYILSCCALLKAAMHVCLLLYAVYISRKIFVFLVVSGKCERVDRVTA